MPALLIALSAVPVIAGVVRVVGLAGGAEITPENARFFAAPVSAVLHIVSVSVWCVLGAFQFSSGLRRRSPGWHRAAIRLVVGSAMVLFICLGFVAIRRRDIAGHRAWMVRGYALGLGAGTQVLTHVPWLLFGGIRNELSRALAMGAGWAINLAVAEWLLRRRPALPARSRALGSPS